VPCSEAEEDRGGPPTGGPGTPDQTNTTSRLSDSRTATVRRVMRQQLCSIALSLSLASTEASAQSVVTAFERFNVVPMASDTVLRDYTVLVTDGKITTVGPSRTVKAPRGASRVDGRGTQYLVPALVDMHTRATNPQDLAPFASHGVLTVLNLGWSPQTFVAFERLRYNSGERFGPTIFEGLLVNWPYGRSPGPGGESITANDHVRVSARPGAEQGVTKHLTLIV
jgi:hypothetical protein